MTWQAWLLFCATETVLCFTPGPAVLTVVSTALTRGAGAGFGTSLGILAANAAYFALSATGIGVVLIALPGLFLAVKWAGAAYLIWLGLRMILSRKSPLAGSEAAPGRSRGSPGPFMTGLITQGANPKAIVFFAALLPQFIDPASSAALQVLILGVTSILIELGVLSLYVGLCHTTRRLFDRPALAVSLNRAGGLLLMAAAAGIATLRSP